MTTATRTIKLLATLRDVAGAKAITVPLRDGETVREFIAALSDHHPTLWNLIVTPDGELTGAVHVFVNGRNIQWLSGLDTVLTARDEVILIPPSAGG